VVGLQNKKAALSILNTLLASALHLQQEKPNNNQTKLALASTLFFVHCFKKSRT